MCPPFLRIKFIKKNSPHDQALRQPCKFLILAILEIRVKHPIRIKVMIKDKMGKSAPPPLKILGLKDQIMRVKPGMRIRQARQSQDRINILK